MHLYSMKIKTAMQNLLLKIQLMVLPYLFIAWWIYDRYLLKTNFFFKKLINFSTYLSRATFFHMFSVSAEDSSLATMWHSGISGLGSNWRSRSNLIGPAGCPEFVLMMSFLFLRGVRRVFTGEGILHLKNKNIYCFGLVYIIIGF